LLQHPRPSLFPYTTLFRSFSSRALIAAATTGPSLVSQCAKDACESIPRPARSRIDKVNRPMSSTDKCSSSYVDTVVSGMILITRLNEEYQPLKEFTG